jgi:hypothetical protein
MRGATLSSNCFDTPLSKGEWILKLITALSSYPYLSPTRLGLNRTYENITGYLVVLFVVHSLSVLVFQPRFGYALPYLSGDKDFYWFHSVLRMLSI